MEQNVPTRTLHAPDKQRVVIIGSGFGGLFAAQALKHADVDVTVIAKTTHHLFQPLLYQVATGILSEGEIAPSTREVLHGQRNVRVLLGEVTEIDVDARTVTSHALNREKVTSYDKVIVATGVGESYFGNDHFAQYAPGMKSIDDALELRGRIFNAFELAELEEDPDEISRLLTFVVVGAGPTGVEMAGQIAELSTRTLRRDFDHIDPSSAQVILLDAAGAVLPAFGDKLGGYAQRRLTKMGVDIQLDARVINVDAAGLEVQDADGIKRRIEAETKVWAAGVAAGPLGKQLADQTGSRLDRAGRVSVNDDLTLPGHPEIFVIGDLATLNGLPGVAQVAIQGGRHAAAQIERELEGWYPSRPFRYHDKGSMATVSRFSAVASIGKIRLTGFIAWVAWLAVHLVYIIGFKSRITTLLHWTASFIGRGRSERTVTEQQVLARNAMAQLGDDHVSTFGNREVAMAAQASHKAVA